MRRACAPIASTLSISMRFTTTKASRYTIRLDVAGHPWTVACLPTPSFDADRRTLWPWGVLVTGLVFTGMLAAYLWLSVDQQEYLQQKVHEQTVDIRRANEEVIDRLVSAAQWSDEETGMHIRRTGLLSEVLARAAGWFGDDVECLRQAAPMHDIGKIGIPDAILQKPGKLTPEEFAVMKTHTRIGADILSGSKSPMLQMAREIALNHHERWDGKGYPRGLAGKAIPESRSHRGHRRRVRRLVARSRLSARHARSGSLDDHAAGGRNPFRSAVDDVLLPALLGNPPHCLGTPGRQLGGQARPLVGRHCPGRQRRDFRNPSSSPRFPAVSHPPSNRAAPARSEGFVRWQARNFCPTGGTGSSGGNRTATPGRTRKNVPQ